MSSNYFALLTYMNLMNNYNMNYNSLSNTLNPLNFSFDLSLLNSTPIQTQNEVPKTYNNITVLSSDDDNSTPKTHLKSNKNSGPTIKRTHSQLTEKANKRRSTKSILNSNFSLEDHAEPESAETDYNSPVASQNQQTQKIKQIQGLSSNSERKISQATQINSSQSNQKEDNIQRKKSFFEELEEIAFSYMDTNKKIKLDDQQTQTSLSTQSQLSLSQESQQSSNLINLIPTLPQPQYQQYQQQLQYQSQQQYQQLKTKQSQQLLHYQQLDIIKEEEDDQNSNHKLLKSRKQPQKKRSNATTGKAATKKQTKINQKQTQRGKKQQTQSINEIQINNNNSQNNISIQNNQQINCQISQINFPIQPKPILLNSINNQNSFKIQQQLKKTQPPRVVFAEEVYLKSISQEGSIKLQKFPCFRDSDLQIPAEFSQLIQQQLSDDDKCSGDELLEKAVNYMHKKLVASTIEQNPSAVIPDAEKNFTIQDIKIDRESDEEEEEDEENQVSSHSNNYHSQYSPYNRQSSYYQNNNNFLSDDEGDDNDD